MNNTYAIDHCLDDREFRNLVNTLLIQDGFTSLGFDDARICDGNTENDNDIIITKENIKYTVQTFLNQKVLRNEIDETIKDIKKEKVYGGIVITNTPVSSEIKEYAKQNNIKVLDRTKLLELIELYDK